MGTEDRELGPRRTKRNTLGLIIPIKCEWSEYIGKNTKIDNTDVKKHQDTNACFLKCILNSKTD